MGCARKAIVAFMLQAALNLKYVIAENSVHSNDKFSGVSIAEFRKEHFSRFANRSIFSGLPSLGMHKVRGLKLPDSVDWREQGAVTAVKNQQQCETCWAFAATGAIEGAWKIASGNLVSFSEQQLQDCSGLPNTECYGGGGYPDNAFEAVMQTGLCREDSYPFTGKNGTCQSQCTYGLTQGQLTGKVDVAPNDEGVLMDAVAQQPVAVSIHATILEKGYTPGSIVRGSCPESEDDYHAVLIVGYGTDDAGVDYWLLKNSWGSDWGESGYFRLQRGVGGSGECGIAISPSYPVVSARASEGTSIVV